ncbi:haloacid dehalogenase type II [Pseudonocardia acaciae]|uniref:haloacid dehalogenase type II n=1 Tax=Pseudonocardia acaciae TaxID=551276 RepID=UPI0014702ED3|nr:haloacid dehalogenase type II [Pseudonocardia acaciae]
MRVARWRALFFDVQGTLTDFRSSLVDHGLAVLGGRVDRAAWSKVVDDWRRRYRDELNDLASRGRWHSVRSVYRDALVGLPGRPELAPAEIEVLTDGWERLRPWPDVPRGLARLREDHLVAALSNADLAAVVNISRHAGLEWDAVFSAEVFGAYKPDSSVYERALALLRVDPSDALMVASHAYDLDAARAVGMGAAYIRRPLEFGPGGGVEEVPRDRFEFVVDGLGALAEKISAGWRR